jgi:hypothetical protein
MIAHAHVVEEKLEVEKVRRKIGWFSRNVRHDFFIYNNFFPCKLFSLLLFGNVRDILKLRKLFLR